MSHIEVTRGTATIRVEPDRELSGESFSGDRVFSSVEYDPSDLVAALVQALDAMGVGRTSGVEDATADLQNALAEVRSSV